MTMPPKIVGEELIRREKAISAYAKTGVVPDKQEFPVLGAIGEFIEMERRRTRIRMLIMGGFFLLIILLMAAGFFLAGLLMYNNMRDGLDGFRQSIVEYRQRLEQNEKNSAEIAASLDARTKGLQDSIQQQDKAVAATRKQIESDRRKYEQEIDDLKEKVSLYEIDSRTLKKDMQTANTKIPELMQQIDILSRKIAAMQSSAMIRAVQKPPAATHHVVHINAEDLPKRFNLELLPAGAARKVTWLLPTPE